MAKRKSSQLIDPSLLTQEDKEMVQDLTVAAINNAMAKADISAKEEIKKSTEGIMPMPSMDLGGIF